MEQGHAILFYFRDSFDSSRHASYVPKLTCDVIVCMVVWD